MLMISRVAFGRIDASHRLTPKSHLWKVHAVCIMSSGKDGTVSLEEKIPRLLQATSDSLRVLASPRRGAYHGGDE